MEKEKKIISVVSPVYKAEDCILELYKRLSDSLSNITSSYEILFVEDGGKDKSWEYIKEIAHKDSKVKAIKLSRNFGQHYAISAGLKYTQSDYIVVMDCDLQDQPEEIEKLYKKVLEGYDFVTASRKERKDSFFKRLSSKLFYSIYNYLSGTFMDNKITNFGIYHHKVIENLRHSKEQIQFFPIAIKWLGFNSTNIDVEHSKRFSGQTSYTFIKLFNCAFDNIISNSGKPLLIIFKFGLIMSIIFFLFGLSFVIKLLIYGTPLPGWTSLIVTLNFIGGLIIMSLGIIGAYIEKIFRQVKGKPLYIIDQTINI